MTFEIVVFANALPYTDPTRPSWRPADGGLVRALRSALGTRKARWVGWDSGVSHPASTPEGIRLHPITLTPEQVAGHYLGFANRTLWPLFHDLAAWRPVIDRGWWERYREVNGRFADAAAGLDLGPDAFLWVHDYQLLLLPLMLRQRLVRRIGFFLHTPFPPPDLLGSLPWRAALLEGMLGADVLAFQGSRCQDNFLQACQRFLSVETTADSVRLDDGRRVRTHPQPISIDAKAFASDAMSPAVEACVRRLRAQLGNRRLLLGVDRLDYTKGISERLAALEELFRRRAELVHEVTVTQIVVPSREAVPEYAMLRTRLEGQVGHLNGMLTVPGAQPPLRYLYRAIPPEWLLAYYRCADVAMITSLRDGMNLTAKEFVVVQGAANGEGALLLSRHAGAAVELVDAVLCDPSDAEQLVGALDEAIRLPDTERRSRIARLSSQVHAHDIAAWLRGVLEAHGLAG